MQNQYMRGRVMLEEQIDKWAVAIEQLQKENEQLKQRIEKLENRYFRPLPPTSASGSDAGSTRKNGGSNRGEHAKTAEVKNDTA
jgi:TolA-binding protein